MSAAGPSFASMVFRAAPHGLRPALTASLLAAVVFFAFLTPGPCLADQQSHGRGLQYADPARHAPPAASSRGFCANPFALDYRDPVDAPKPQVRYRDGQKEILPPGADKAENNAATQEEEPDIVVSGSRTERADRLQPGKNPFPGGEHTLSQMDEKPAAEMSMEYRLNDRTSTSVTLNPQDDTSPLHRPVGQERGLNAAGVYMNVEVQPNVRMKVGGEYGEIESRYSPREETAKGAAVGLEWSF